MVLRKHEVLSHLALLVRSRGVESSACHVDCLPGDDLEGAAVDAVSCDEFIDYVSSIARRSSREMRELGEALFGEAGDCLLRCGMTHEDPCVASTCRMLLAAIIGANGSTTVTRLLAPCLCHPTIRLGGQKRARDAESDPLLLEAMRWPKGGEHISSTAGGRRAALQVAIAALHASDAVEVEHVLTLALPTDALLSALADPHVFVAQTARELFCAIVERVPIRRKDGSEDGSSLRASVLRGLRSWWDRRLPSMSTGMPADATPEQPVPSYLLDRRNVDVETEDAAFVEVADVEPAVALAEALLDRAVGCTDAASTWLDVLRDDEVLHRCALLLPDALHPDKPAGVRERALAIVAKACEAGQTEGMNLLLPPSLRPSGQEESTSRVITWVAGEAEALLRAGAPTAAVRLAAACLPSRNAPEAIDPVRELPQPVSLVLRAMRVCLLSSLHTRGMEDAPTQRSLDAGSTAGDDTVQMAGRERSTLLHAMRAMTAWSLSGWHGALLASDCAELLVELMDGLVDGWALPAVPCTHMADDTRLLRATAHCIASLFGRSQCTLSISRLRVARAISSLGAALAFSVGNQVTPLEGAGVRRLGSDAPRALLEALTAITGAHGKDLLADSAGQLAEGDSAEGRTAGEWPTVEMDAARERLARGLRIAAASSEAEVRRATGDAFDALLAADGGLGFVLHARLVPVLATLATDSHDELTRAAAHAAATRLAASEAGWEALRVCAPDWFRDLWRELRHDEPSTELALSTLRALRAAVLESHLRTSALRQLRAVLSADDEMDDAADELTAFELALTDGLEALCGSPNSLVAMAALELLEAMLSGEEAGEVAALSTQLRVDACADAAAQHTDTRVRLLAARVAPDASHPSHDLDFEAQQTGVDQDLDMDLDAAITEAAAPRDFFSARRPRHCGCD